MPQWGDRRGKTTFAIAVRQAHVWYAVVRLTNSKSILLLTIIHSKKERKKEKRKEESDAGHSPLLGPAGQHFGLEIVRWNFRITSLVAQGKAGGAAGDGETNS
jgi:hypothetical protein